jgi:hypothetical protein
MDMGKNTSQDFSYAFIAAIILLSLALVAISFNFYSVKHEPAQNITEIGSASLRITVTAPEYTVEEFVLTLSGLSSKEYGYFKLGPSIYDLNTSAVKGIYTASGPISVSSSAELNNTVVVPHNSSTIFFSGLVPDSNYTITINGSESPYCFPGLACPMFILRLLKYYNVHTGPANSTENITINTLPSVQLNASTTASCSYQLPIYANQSTYAKCYDGSRLLNFELLAVNENNTITGYVYPPYTITAINKSVSPYKAVFHYGQEVSFSCTGYIIYLNSSSYQGQYAVFRVLHTHPIPCPAS